jgi:hypothetical protein
VFPVSAPVPCRALRPNEGDAGREAVAAESRGRPREPAERGPNASPEARAQPGRRAARLLPRPETARASEPILIPKLRIGFADFPYLHCSIDQRLITLETCCGLGTARGENYTASLGFSRANADAPAAA